MIGQLANTNRKRTQSANHIRFHKNAYSLAHFSEKWDCEQEINFKQAAYLHINVSHILRV